MSEWNKPAPGAAMVSAATDKVPENEAGNEAEERRIQIGLLIGDLRAAAGGWDYPVETTMRMVEVWFPVLERVPLDEIARRDFGSIATEMMRRKLSASADFLGIWNGRQGRGDEAALLAQSSREAETRFAAQRDGGPGHRELMAVGATLGWKTEG